MKHSMRILLVGVTVVGYNGMEAAAQLTLVGLRVHKFSVERDMWKEQLRVQRQMDEVAEILSGGSLTARATNGMKRFAEHQQGVVQDEARRELKKQKCVEADYARLNGCADDLRAQRKQARGEGVQVFKIIHAYHPAFSQAEVAQEVMQFADFDMSGIVPRD